MITILILWSSKEGNELCKSTDGIEHILKASCVKQRYFTQAEHNCACDILRHIKVSL